MFDAIKDIGRDLFNEKKVKRKLSRELKRPFKSAFSAKSVDQNDFNKSDIYGYTGSIVGKY